MSTGSPEKMRTKLSAPMNSHARLKPRASVKLATITCPIGYTVKTVYSTSAGATAIQNLPAVERRSTGAP